MLAITKSIALQGLEGYLVSIEVDISPGMPYFEIVGLPDMSVKESRERVKTAIKNSEINFASKRIIVNLAPANTRKGGSNFDLPIAVGILIAMEVIKNEEINEYLKNTIFIGELSLNGKIERVNGILPICIEAKKLGIKRIVLPVANAEEARVIQGIEIIPIKDIKQLKEYLNKKTTISKTMYKNIEFKTEENYKFDFKNIKGQKAAKRALEVVAAGGHNCLLIRKPWCWKNNVSKKFAQYIARYEQ